MSLIKILGGLKEATQLLANPLANKATHHNYVNKKFLCKYQYIQTKPWREVSAENNFLPIDDPNLNELINIGDLCLEVANLKTHRNEDNCIIWDNTAQAYISDIAGKGLAFYLSVDFNEAMQISVNEALDIILKLKCSDEIQQGMQIRLVKQAA